jgi:hypothetical protein
LLGKLYFMVQGQGREKMSSTYDELNVRTTEEILKNNVHDLQGQLVNANKRVASLRDTLNNIINMHKDIEYKLQGIEIYVHDIKELIDD